MNELISLNCIDRTEKMATFHGTLLPLVLLVTWSPSQTKVTCPVSLPCQCDLSIHCERVHLTSIPPATENSQAFYYLYLSDNIITTVARDSFQVWSSFQLLFSSLTRKLEFSGLSNLQQKKSEITFNIVTAVFCQLNFCLITYLLSKSTWCQIRCTDEEFGDRCWGSVDSGQDSNLSFIKYRTTWSAVSISATTRSPPSTQTLL